MAENATNDVPVAPATDAVPVEPAAPAAPAATEPDPVLDILTEGTDDPTKAAPSTVKDEKSQVADTTPADVNRLCRLGLEAIGIALPFVGFGGWPDSERLRGGLNRSAPGPIRCLCHAQNLKPKPQPCRPARKDRP